MPVLVTVLVLLVLALVAVVVLQRQRQLRERQAAAAEAQRLRTQRAELRTRIDSAAQEVETTRAQLAAAQTKVDAARADVDSTRAELAAARRERDETRTELDAARADLETARSDAAGARDETAALVSDLEERISRLQAELSAARAPTPVAGVPEAGGQAGGTRPTDAALWALELARSERTWRHSVAPLPDGDSPFPTAEDPLRLAVEVEAAALREDVGAPLDVEWSAQVTDPGRCLLVLRLAQELLASAARESQSATLRVDGDGEVVLRLDATGRRDEPVPVSPPPVPEGIVSVQQDGGGLRIVISA